LSETTRCCFAIKNRT
jgi:hypothetical protein